MDNHKYLKEKTQLSSVYGEILEPMEKAAENGDPLAAILLVDIPTEEKEK